jgi:hypothetical protein
LSGQVEAGWTEWQESKTTLEGFQQIFDAMAGSIICQARQEFAAVGMFLSRPRGSNVFRSEVVHKNREATTDHRHSVLSTDNQVNLNDFADNSEIFARLQK